MLAVGSFSWRGNAEELKELDKIYKECVENIEGIKYIGRYTSWQSPYNWAYVYETDDMGKFQKAMMSITAPRDYSKIPSFVVEFWSGPF
jgi:hypothetical protein